MFGIGLPELLLVFGIGILLFGGKKLPEMGEGLGQGIANFKLALRQEGVAAPAQKLPAPAGENHV